MLVSIGDVIAIKAKNKAAENIIVNYGMIMCKEFRTRKGGIVDKLMALSAE